MTSSDLARLRYVGVDLTSAFGASPRAVDLAVLDDALQCSFFTASWPSPDLVVKRDVAALTRMFADALPKHPGPTVWAIDGPQALAALGSSRRVCEAMLANPGRTPDVLPAPTSSAPFASYIRSSVDLFAALVSVPGARLGGAPGIATDAADIFEVFPGAEWGVLAGQLLPKKTSPAGRSARRLLFERLGIRGLHAQPTADQNDALVGAWLAWCTRNAPNKVALAGTVPTSDAGVLREGCILHATAAARVVGFDVPAKTETVVVDNSGEWSGGDTLLLRLNDTGGVHGKHPENAWLTPQRSYELESTVPFPAVRISLRFAEAVSGGRSWKSTPTVPALLRQLGEAVHPSNAHPLSVPVRIISSEEDV